MVGPGGRLSNFSAPTQPLKSRICAPLRSLATQPLDGMRPDSHIFATLRFSREH